MTNEKKTISVIVPAFNEEAVILIFWERLMQVMENTGMDYSVVFVNDGSTDQTRERLRQIQQQSSRIKVISFSRNFGHQAALLAGLERARGDCIISLDGDLQHPPELIPTLIERWKAGSELVLTKRVDATDTPPTKMLTSRLFYKLFSGLSGLELTPGMADFWLIDRRVADAMRQLGERSFFLRGMLQWVGFRQETVEYQAANRAGGQSKYTWLKMGKLALDGITSFSIVPLHLATLLGFVFSFLSFLYLLFAIVTVFITDLNLPGWTSVIGSVLFLGGIQLICLGILGEYLGKIFLEVKRRPHYIVESEQGFTDA